MFRINYFLHKNLYALFIACGIAGHNIFVLKHTWNGSSELFTEDKVKEKLAYTVRKAGKGIFATTVTTAVAYVAAGWSHFIPLQSLAFYTGILIVVNALLVVIVFPTLIVQWE